MTVVGTFTRTIKVPLDRILVDFDSRFQRISLWQENDNSISLGLGHPRSKDVYWQFNSNCVDQYHKALIGDAMPSLRRPLQKALVCGGGDGFAARDLIAASPNVEVDVIELDPEMIRLARGEIPGSSVVKILNRGAFNHPRVRCQAGDALKFFRNPLRHRGRKWDFIVLDFPDPTDPVIAQLYSKPFYELVRNRVEPGGVVTLQGDLGGPILPNIRLERRLREVWNNVAGQEVRLDPLGKAFFYVAC